MKNLILIIFLISISDAFSFSKTFKVVDRKKNFKVKEFNRKLTDFISRDSFDGKHFKIVYKKSNTAIKFSNRKLRLKAATTYYHLTKARNYFVKKLKSEYVKNMPKITIRLELTNVFNELGHFANDNLDPQYNNALSIPAGNGFPGRGIQPWGQEIWFRPLKKIHLKELDQTRNVGSFKALFQQFRTMIHQQSLNQFLIDAFRRNAYDNLETGDKVLQFIRTSGSSLLLELSIWQSNFIEYLFTRKWYKLDSALVPEIIYHEFAHLALSDNLELSHSTPVIEGMADYFAIKISGNTKLAKKIKKYNTFNGKDAENTKYYQINFETNEYANEDFVLGLLYAVSNTVNSDTNGELFIYNMRNYIDTNSSIRDKLLNAIFTHCEKHCQSPLLMKLRLNKLFYEKGI